MTTLDFASATALQHGIAVVQLHEELWRVTRPDGDVLGYVEQLQERDGTRFRAKRLLVRQRRFVSIGEFWTMDDALDCFRAG